MSLLQLFCKLVVLLIGVEELLSEGGDLLVYVLELLFKNLVLFIPILDFVHHLNVFGAQLGDVLVLLHHKFLVSLLLVHQLGLQSLRLCHDHAAVVLVLPIGAQ